MDPLERWLGKPGDKSRAEFEHTVKRAKERYDLDLDAALYQRLCVRVRGQEAGCSFLGRQSTRVSVWAILEQGRRLLACYDKKRHRIVTLLPPDAIDAHGICLVEGAEGLINDPRPRKQRITDEEWPPKGVVPIEGA